MDETPKLPSWEEFRPIRPRESRLEYLAAAIEFDMGQTRKRDHWFANQLSVVYTSQDLLHRDLMGDGTLLKPGILPVMEQRQREIPEMIRQALRESQNKDDARSYSTLKKWLWGVLGGSIVTGVGVILYVIVGVHP